MADFILHNYFRSSTSFRVRIALTLKGINYDYKAVNLLKGEQHSSEYKKINPIGGVPTLIHKGKIIPDSYAIIEYLEETIPQPALLPKEAYLRARVRQVCEIVNSAIHPLGNLRITQYLEKKLGFTAEQKENWIQHWAYAGLDALEANLKEFSGKYSFGDEVTMADIFLIPQIITCQRFKVDMTNYPTLMKIFENCMKHEAFIKAHPFRQPDTPDEMRIS